MLSRNFQKLKHEVACHVEADRVAPGSYSTCFIGCLAHGKDDPDYIEAQYGIPLMITRIAESIFEVLPADEAPKFFAVFPEAIGCDGKDLSLVGWKFLAAELRSLPPVPDDIQAVINSVITGMDLLASGEEWSREKAVKALMAASSFTAAHAAAAVCYAAHAAAYTADAADAADAAARAADVSVDAARAAAYIDSAHAVACAADASVDAARAAAHAARRRQRDLLLKLIKEAPNPSK